MRANDTRRTGTHTTTRSDVLALALAAARLQGFSVFPLAGKIPAIKGGRGCKDASSDPEKIRELFARAPHALSLIHI